MNNKKINNLIILKLILHRDSIMKIINDDNSQYGCKRCLLSIKSGFCTVNSGWPAIYQKLNLTISSPKTTGDLTCKRWAKPVMKFIDEEYFNQTNKKEK